MINTASKCMDMIFLLTKIANHGLLKSMPHLHLQSQVNCVEVVRRLPYIFENLFFQSQEALIRNLKQILLKMCIK